MDYKDPHASEPLAESMMMSREVAIKDLQEDVRAIRFTSGMTCMACYTFILSNFCAMLFVA